MSSNKCVNGLVLVQVKELVNIKDDLVLTDKCRALPYLADSLIKAISLSKSLSVSASSSSLLIARGWASMSAMMIGLM